MNLKKIIMMVMGLMLSYQLNAQNLISFSGGTLENSGIIVSYSAGDVIAGTFEGSSISIAGGFSNGSNLLATSNEPIVDDRPKVFSLNQNYPNPFNPSTNISFDLPKTSPVQLEIFNSIGAKVATLLNGEKPAGTYSIPFDASDLGSGLYFYRLTAENNVIETKKMLLIK